MGNAIQDLNWMTKKLIMSGSAKIKPLEVEIQLRWAYSRTALRLAMGLSPWLSQDCPLPSLYFLNYLFTDEPIVMELSKGLKKGVGNKFVEVF